ncbi:protein gle1 [Phtheirospermum japonicum]|uniref:mRNA export factor GLE1 n=1 Tax=Phtheirospermum japonicum TaxID=374723 RepID=A0A830CXT2_9LAMI|nr:protein gle1 [Phtheirospermum japonicum]
MGAIELELRCPKNVNGIAADPQPDWSIDNLLSELDSIYQKQNVVPDFPVPFTKTQPIRLGVSRENSHFSRGFHMHVSDESDSDDDFQEEADNSSIVSGRRFVCDELYMSDDSDDGCHLMDKVGLAEGALHELIDEFQLTLSEEVRSKISSLESHLVYENEDFASSTTKIDKHRELQQERERKFDLQYQRTIAEALDNHLTAVQRDHEHMSQLEERKIRDDAAREEAKRKEKALQEEKLRQERNKAEEEVRLKAERAKAAAIEEAEKKAAEEAASKRAAEALKDSVQSVSNSALDVKKEVQSSGKNLIRASENALKLEKQRSQIYGELLAENRSFKESANQDYNRHGQNIGRQIKTISATVENVRTRAEELVKLICDPRLPQSISIQLFAEKMVSYCTNQRSSNAIFAISRVIVMVTSKIPLAMDILIAELNRVCIYTVPKHINYSQEVFRTKDAYFKAIGYKEENGRIESIDDYIERLSSYMRLYGALVQMAGFALHRRYRNQFEKLLGIVARDFLNALKEGGSESWSTKLSKVKMSIRNYIESNQFKHEPEGLQLRGHLESNDFIVKEY